MNVSKTFLGKFLICLLIVSFASSATALAAYGDGSDGSLIVNSSRVVNEYSYLTGDEAAGSSSIDVNDASKFSSGDEILVVQMQNGSGRGVAGVYEFREVESTSSGSLNLKRSLNSSYYSGNFDAVDAESAQVVEVKNFETLKVSSGASVTPKPWNGYIGGIVALRAVEKVSIIGSIDATGDPAPYSSGGGTSAMGFRGGPSRTTEDDIGIQGESYKGLGQCNGQSPNDGGGTGGGNNQTDCTSNNIEGGGGGGSYGTQGTKGYDGNGNLGTDSPPGYSYGKENLSKMFLGSGGGSGANDDDDSTGASGGGGAGGGIVFVSSPDITVEGSIHADGADGQDGYEDSGGAAGEPSGGGGGSGGSIWLRSTSLNVTGGQVTAVGGKGGNPDGGDGYGGDGGNGRIRLDYSTVSGLSNVQPSPGFTGESPDFCDRRGKMNECVVSSSREINSEKVDIDREFILKNDGSIFSPTFSEISVSNHSMISGTLEGVLNFSAESITVKAGTSLVPDKGRILLYHK